MYAGLRAKVTVDANALRTGPSTAVAATAPVKVCVALRMPVQGVPAQGPAPRRAAFTGTRRQSPAACAHGERRGAPQGRVDSGVGRCPAEAHGLHRVASDVLALTPPSPLRRSSRISRLTVTAAKDPCGPQRETQKYQETL